MARVSDRDGRRSQVEGDGSGARFAQGEGIKKETAELLPFWDLTRGSRSEHGSGAAVRQSLENSFYIHEAFTEDEIKENGGQQTDATSANADRLYRNASALYRNILADVMNVKRETRHDFAMRMWKRAKFKDLTIKNIESVLSAVDSENPKLPDLSEQVPSISDDIIQQLVDIVKRDFAEIS